MTVTDGASLETVGAFTAVVFDGVIDTLIGALGVVVVLTGAVGGFTGIVGALTGALGVLTGRLGVCTVTVGAFTGTAGVFTEIGGALTGAGVSTGKLNDSAGVAFTLRSRNASTRTAQILIGALRELQT